MLFRCIETNVPANTRKCGLDTPKKGTWGYSTTGILKLSGS